MAAGIAGALKRESWEVVVAGDAARARPVFTRGNIDLILLDLMLPDADGRELCREIRAGDGPPVIIVSARGSEAERVEGLQLGADDYLPKPFGTAELIARVQAVLRRAGAPPDAQPGRYEIGPLEFDAAARRVRVHQEELNLTPREYSLLLALVERRGTVVTRDELLGIVWGPGWLGNTKALDVQVSALRRKLGENPEKPLLLHTIRGIGFMLDEQ